MTERILQFGPLLRWELLRLARSGQFTRTRVLLLYVLLLATVLFLVWWAAPANPLRIFRGEENLIASSDVEEKRGAGYFAECLALVLLETQLLFVAILAPGQGAAAIADEKEKRTLPLLLTTQLSPREIVFGKALARGLSLFASTLASIPLLSLPLLYGAFPWELALSGFALVLGTAMLGTCLGAAASCAAPDTRSALLRAYALGALFIGGLPFLMKLGPVAILGYEGGFRAPFGWKQVSVEVRLCLVLLYASLQAVLGLVILLKAAPFLRSREPSFGSSEPTAYPEPPRGRPTPLVLDSAAEEPLYRLPPLDHANPMLWKERHASRSMSLLLLGEPVKWFGGLLAVAALTLFAIGAWQLLTRAVLGLDPDEARQLAIRGQERPPGGIWLLSSGLLSAGLFLLPVLAGVSGSVAGERQRGTLESLLATLVPRYTILGAKVWAQMERWLAIGVGSLTAIGCAFAAQGGLEAGVAAFAGMAAALGLSIACSAWLSVVCDSPAQAFRMSLVPASGVVLLPLIVWTLTDWNDLAQTTSWMWRGAAGFALLGIAMGWKATADL